MLLGVLWLVVAIVALTVGSGLLAAGVGALAERRRLPVAPVRSLAVGLAAATATTVIATGRGQGAIAGGIPSGTAMFALGAAFGAALLLGRRPVEVREPVSFAAPGVALVLVALFATDRASARGEGVLMTLLFLLYAAWAVMEPGREPLPAAVPTPSGPPFPADLPPPTDPPPPVEPAPPVAEPAAGTRRVAVLGMAGVALVVGGGFGLVEGTLRVALRTPLVPGFAGAAIAGSIAALPFALLVVFPRRRAADADPAGATLTVLTGLVTLVPGVASIVRPFELDGPATAALLAAAALYTLAGAWMLVRGHGGRVLGVLVLAAYAAGLLYAGSL
jgi:hypothetical protein